MKTLRIILVIHILFFVGWAGIEEYKQYQAPTILLKTLPVDPRDFLSGNYMTLRYEIGQPEKLPGFNGSKIRRNTTIGIYLKGNTVEVNGSQMKIFAPEKAQIPPPSLSDKQNPENGIWVTGRWTGSNYIVYGIERYYFSEKRKQELNSFRSGNVYAEVSVSKNGVMNLKNIILK